MLTKYSAVDAHVAQHLHDNALTGELGLNRTRVLATHHIGLCISKASYIVVLGKRGIEQSGSPEHLRERGQFEHVMNLHQLNPNILELMLSQSGRGDGVLNGLPLAKSDKQENHVADRDVAASAQKAAPKKFVKEELRAEGSVNVSAYMAYFKKSGGVLFWLPILGFFIAHECLSLGRSWFIGIWTRANGTRSALFQTSSHSQHIDTQRVVGFRGHGCDLNSYLGIYLGLSVALCVMGTLRSFLIYMRSIRASKEMFEAMTYTVLRAPLRWFDTVPVGRILNRFTSDFESIDSRLGSYMAALGHGLMQTIGIVIAAVFVSPWILVIAIVLLSACTWLTSWYIVGAREVKRLESVAKSPIFELFGSTLTGLGTIRVFDRTALYVDRMFERIDAHARALWHVRLFNGWITFRLNVLGAVFATVVAAAVIFSSRVDASLAGFALSFALQYSSTLCWTTHSYANVELQMNSVERVSEYSEIAIEDESNSANRVSASWPSEGRLEVSELTMAYAPDTPPVLKGLTFSVAPNERVGVVGRTGAGKSSLALALFRFLHVRAGSIHIDGVDTADVPVSILRSRLAIIPQDPVLFLGTVRSNLDPFNACDDTELLDALRRVRLSASPPAQEITLNTPIAGSGLNLSQGQRQLLCLARAIVRRPKLLILDEATSAVDGPTDKLIQGSIKSEFAHSTLLVIAHRLSTIADFDKILVMEDGCAVEFGRPKDLLLKTEGKAMFRDLVKKSGERQELEDVILSR